MKKEPIVIAGFCGILFLAGLAGIGIGGYYLVKHFESVSKDKERAKQKEARRAEEREQERMARKADRKRESNKVPPKDGPPRQDPPTDSPKKPPVATLVQSETRAEKAAKRADPLFQKSRELLKTAQYKESVRAFQQAKSYVQSYRQSGVINDRPVSEWLDPKIDAYVKDWEAIGNTFATELTKKDPDISRICKFLHETRYLSLNRKLQMKLHRDLTAYLRKNFNDIVYVQADRIIQPYRKALRDIFTAKFPRQKGFPLQIKFSEDFPGFYPSPRIRVYVRIEEKPVTYRIDRGTISLPGALVVSFNTSEDRELKTSWDKIKTFVVSSNPPKQLTQTDRNALTLQYRKALADQLEAKADSIPEFSLFPDEDASALSVLKDGTFSSKHALVLAYKNRPRLESQLSATLDSSDGQTRFDAIIATIQYDVNSLAPKAMETLRSLRGYNVGQVNYVLSENVGFGNYEPALEILRKQYSWRLMAAMSKRSVEDPALVKPLTELCTDTSIKHRHQNVIAFLAGLPEDKRTPYDAWLLDSNPEVAKVTVDALCSSAKRTEECLLRNYAKVSKEIRIAMWKRVANQRIYGKRGYSKKLLDFNKKTCLDSDADVAKAAARAIAVNAYAPEIWNVTEELRTKAKGEAKRALETGLFSNLGRVDEKTRIALLKQILLDRHKELYALCKKNPKEYSKIGYRSIRQYPMEKLMGVYRDDTKALFKFFADIQKASPGDYLFDYDVISTLRRFLRGNKYDYTSKDLKTFLVTALKDPNCKGKRNLYEVLIDGMKNGKDPFYRKTLEAAMAKETAAHEKSYIKRALGK